MTWLSRIVVAVALLFGASAPAQADWLRAESPHFIVYSEGSERATREAIGDLEEFDALLRRMLRVDPDLVSPKLEIYLHENRRSFERVFGERDNVAGLYASGPELVGAFAIFRNAASGLDSRAILFHEYTHHFMAQFLTASYPAWYVEGFAEFLSTVEFERTRIIIGDYMTGRAYSLLEYAWLPTERMLTAKVSDIEPRQRHQFYAQGWFATHYFYSTPERSQKLIAYFDRLRAPGADPLAAFTETIGMSPEDFHQELRAARSRPLARWATARIESARGAPIAFSALPASANRLLALDLRLRHQVRREDGEQLLAETRQLAANYPDDGFAALVLARAEITLARPADGRALLEPLLAADPEHANALYLMGLSHVMDARATSERADELESYRAARRYFARAFRQTPEHVPTLYRYVETYVYEAERPPSSVIDVMVTARNLAPQVEEIALRTAVMLMRERRYDEVVLILRPAAFNPHGGAQAEAALRMMTEAERALRDGQAPSGEN